MARKQAQVRLLGRASQVTLGGVFGTYERDGLQIAPTGLGRR